MRKEKTAKFGGYVRITGGIYKGGKIHVPLKGTHPMGERERIALFNMISEYLPGAEVLDLYCGGGTLGIEALSRGAKSDLAIDLNRDAVLTTIANMFELGVIEISGNALQDDANEITKNPSFGMLEFFDIVFADPPYDLYNEKMVAGLPNLVKKGGILVLSHPTKAPDLTGMTLLKTRKYAAAHISIYVRN